MIDAPRDEPLPADLASPRRDAEEVRMWAGIVTGGVLMVICVGLLVVATLT